MKSQWKTSLIRLSLVIAAYMVLTIALPAQVKKSTTTTEGTATKEVTVERAEVVNVSGNDLIVKMENGQIRHLANVPESARVTVDGKELGIHDLKPGMKLERTITVTSIPKTITTVETVTGTVYHVTPPTSVILTLENGQNQQFKIPAGQKFTVDGQETDAWGLKKGMKVSATRITEVGETAAEQETKVAGTMPPPPIAPPANAPILIATAAPTPVPAAPAPTTTAQTASAPTEKGEAAAKGLPQTGSPLPLIGLFGLLLTGSSFFLRWTRR
jgi:LPXTG-motif cell wall-anchored protein